jgi:hypothetical protein
MLHLCKSEVSAQHQGHGWESAVGNEIGGNSVTSSNQLNEARRKVTAQQQRSGSKREAWRRWKAYVLRVGKEIVS